MDFDDIGVDIGLTDFSVSDHQSPPGETSTQIPPVMDIEWTFPWGTTQSQQEGNTKKRPISVEAPAGPEFVYSRAPKISISPVVQQADATVDTLARATAIRKVPKKSRFTEMIRKSFSTSWDKSVAYEATRNTAGQTTSVPFVSPGAPKDPNHLHPITEYNKDENVENSDCLSLNQSAYS